MSEPDRDLLALGLTFKDGVLHPPGHCRVKLVPVRNRYLIKIVLPNGNNALALDIPKHQLRITYNKRAKP